MKIIIGVILVGIMMGVMCLAGAWVIQEGINQAYEWKQDYEERQKEGKGENEEL